VIWLDLEPKPGQWDFSRLDRYVAMAGLVGSEILLPFGMTPAWASARPNEKGTYRPGGDSAEPGRLEDWENYVRTVARRYKSRIRHYELWNEVNAGTGFFSGTPEAMFNLQKSAYRVVKEIDPGATFVSPSSVGEAPHQLKWFESYLALGAARHADVIAYHFYQPRKKPEAILELVQKVREIMARQGAASKPLWNTESGYRMALGQKKALAADPSWPALEPEVAAAFVARALILGWWAGLDRFYWYAWDNIDLGLIGPDAAVTPAGRAYLATARWMTGARFTACNEKGSVWLCELRRGDQRNWLVWSSTENELRWRVPAVTAKTAESLDGTLVNVAADRTLTLNGRPQLLREAP
jgi:hypothetical protein